MQGDADAEQDPHFAEAALLTFPRMMAMGQQVIQEQEKNDAADQAREAVEKAAAVDGFGDKFQEGNVEHHPRGEGEDQAEKAGR